MISVSSHLGYLPYHAKPLQKNQFILDKNCNDSWVKWCISNKNQAIDSFDFRKNDVEQLLSTGLMGGEKEIAEYERGGTLWCITYTFMPDELKSILKRYDVKNV